MRAFSVRWRDARRLEAYEAFADDTVGAWILAALEAGGGMSLWQQGTLWRCPGCGDRTLRANAFLEGLQRAEIYLEQEEARRRTEGEPPQPAWRATLDWMAEVTAKIRAGDRDKVYLKDEGTVCTYGI